MKFIVTAFGLSSLASAHTIFTTLFVNGKSQGDGTCVRMPLDGATSTGPVYPITGDDMACGRNGGDAVKFTCPAPRASTLSFQFRIWSNGEKPGVIDKSHLGPCAVYLKKVTDMYKDKPAGSGWFKIWEDGLDTKTGQWCVNRLIDNKGLLSVKLPAGLPSGYYLVRPEILALQNVPQGDPQFYLGCAQIFVQDGPQTELQIPSGHEASIPGHVNASTPGLTYNIYEKGQGEYLIPGPKVYIPGGYDGKDAKSEASGDGGAGAKQEQKQGKVPNDCVVKNANWCAKPLPAYETEDGCWAATKACYDQGQTCWDSAPPSGDANCKLWQDYCKTIEGACQARKTQGPPKFDGVEKTTPVSAEMLQPWNDVFKGQSGAGDGVKSVASTPSPMATTLVKVTSTSVPGGEEETTGVAGGEEEATGVPGGEDETAPRPTRTVTATYVGTLPTAVYPAPPDVAGSSSTGGFSSAVPVESETDPVKVSVDGRCGGSSGQTCKGSHGNCCSSKGWCGRTTRYCGCGCQPGFGDCPKQGAR
ncbi:hypothetical protein RJ55_06549 [Drechmeria coniospora]|nr:hypothetical protein RJ55_06549 [Drechmeria coniospora]